MEFINKSITQLSDLFRSMTPGARITAALLLAVVVVSIGYLFRQGTAGPDAFLFGGEPLSEAQLTAAEAAIAKAKLSGYQREGNRIRVPASQKAAYLAAVADAGALPPNFNTILENALDKGGPWESAAATRERLKIARQQTLSEIIRAMHWVDDAVVLYHEQEARSGRGLGLTKHTTASVSVKPILGEVLDPVRVKNLQKLVAHSVTMNVADVNVTNLGDGGGMSDGNIYPELLEDEYLKTKVAYELQKRESILNALRDIPGVRVEVNAELDKTYEKTTRDVRPDKTASAASHEIEIKEETNQTVAKGGGRPGNEAVGPNRQAANEATQQNSNTTKKSTDERSIAVGVTENVVSEKGFAPKEIWATVTLPRNYIVSVWKQRNPQSQDPPKPEDLSAIESTVIRNVQEVVEPLLILQANKLEDSYKHVKVVVLDSLPGPTFEPPSMRDQAIAWAGHHWTTVAMLGVAMFSLLVLRSVAKGGPTGSDAGPARSTSSLTLVADEAPAKTNTSTDADEPADDDRPRLRLKKSKSLKDDLVEIVKEDPDAAAEILRSWIGKAG